MSSRPRTSWRWIRRGGRTWSPTCLRPTLCSPTRLPATRTCSWFRKSSIDPMTLDLSIAAAGERLRSGELSAVALTRAALDRIAATERALHAFLTVTADQALAAAAEADARLRAGSAGPLTGIPVAVKDVIAT